MDNNESEQRIAPHKRLTSVRVCVRVTGVVQGVGFRPFVFRLATELGLHGKVCNKGGTVEIELKASASNIEVFLQRLQAEAPPVAKIESVEILEIVELAETETEGQFQIGPSQVNAGAAGIEISPDIATCKDCLSELFDEDDRRYRYPFLNCTNCGPRFTIIEVLPYDRAATSMRCFSMCEDCRYEYSDPLNRRFHAQPNACSQCGPTLAFLDPKDQVPKELALFEQKSNEALERTITALSEGKIVAIKGLGGFHLVCDATNDGAVSQLRQRKGREEKPFAIMMPSKQHLVNICQVSDFESKILEGQFRPIVLLKKRSRMEQTRSNESTDSPEPSPPLSALIAPKMQTLGVMLPYTPLHHLLLRDFKRPLVMTSANFSEEPIASGNREAWERLATIADAFLIHNRDITSRYDDTVTRTINGEELVIRRARGYAPRAIELAFRATVPVLALGGHLKNTFCLIKDNKAYVSQHIGDLDTLETVEHFQSTLASYLKIFAITPELLAIDMHPDYGSTKLAQSWLTNPDTAPFDIRKIRQIVSTQHHHAHIASCIAEHRIDGPVIGVAFDGIGYGADQNLWGGEFFHCSFDFYERMARFKNTGMPGGVNAIKEPWRMALSYLASCSIKTRDSKTVERILERFSVAYGKQNVSAVYSKLASSDLTPKTSSCGRLFDAVSALLGLCEIARYEGHAAILLENCASTYDCKIDPQAYPFKHGITIASGKEIIEIDTTSIFECIVEDMENCVEDKVIAARFHETIATAISVICKRIRSKCKTSTACLSGGVFQNERLLCRTRDLLAADQFVVLTNNLVPANDGGLSLGQASIALAQAKLQEI